MPVYLLSTMNPPMRVINQLHKIFVRFFWANAVGSRNSTTYHGITCAILKLKGELASDHYMLSQRSYVLSYGETSESSLLLYEVNSCGINIVKIFALS